jgi:hypothetical protein
MKLVEADVNAKRRSVTSLLRQLHTLFLPSPAQLLPTSTMAQNPREHLERLQMMMRQRRGGFGGFGGGAPGGARSVAALVALGIGGVLLSDSLFNGE